jgi:hypothetical protein
MQSVSKVFQTSTKNVDKEISDKMNIEETCKSHETDLKEIVMNHDEAVNEMSTEDNKKFHEDERNVYTCKDLEKCCDITNEEGVANINKAQKVVLGKSTMKKGVKRPTK